MTPRTITTIVFAILTIISNRPASAQLPDPGFTIDLERTALVITDPQNDFLSPDGVTWGVVGKSVTENHTVENIEALFKAAKQSGLQVFISPHYYYKHDHHWKFEGALESLMHKLGMFDRKGALNLEGFEGSGADWLDRYKKYINDGKTVVVSPHKVYGPESNDLALQLRKRGIDKVILGGMSANLCTESHMRELVEQGFEVAVVRDATAAAVLPEYDGYQAALVNFRMIASHVWTTQEAVQSINDAAAMEGASTESPPHMTSQNMPRNVMHTDAIDNIDREAGPSDTLTVLPLQVAPGSSHALRHSPFVFSDRYHVVAPGVPAYPALRPCLCEYQIREPIAWGTNPPLSKRTTTTSPL